MSTFGSHANASCHYRESALGTDFQAYSPATRERGRSAGELAEFAVSSIVNVQFRFLLSTSPVREWWRENAITSRVPTPFPSANASGWSET